MQDNNTKQTKTRERSTPYPSTTLESAIEMVTELKKALGKGPYSRAAIAEALGHPKLTGPAARKVAALSHYGLIERSGDVYTLSNVVEDILHPVDDNQRKRAIAETASSPALFSKLLAKFDGQSLPQRLDSILIREGVGSNAATEVAETFKSTLEFAGLLANGVVSLSPNSDNEHNMDHVGDNDGKVKSVSGEGQSVFKEKGYSFSDSGSGWQLNIVSEVPLTTNIRKALVDLVENLEKANKGNKEGNEGDDGN